MKKSIFVLVLAAALFAAGCSREEAALPQTPPGAESTDAADIGLHGATGRDGAPAEAEESLSPEAGSVSRTDELIASVSEQSRLLNHSLENDPLTQADMNEISLELYGLWDDALNAVWAEAKNHLPEEAFESLQNEQLAWIAGRDEQLKEAGKEFEGGSLYPLIVNTEAARLTEERVYELYDLLRQTESAQRQPVS